MVGAIADQHRTKLDVLVGGDHVRKQEQWQRLGQRDEPDHQHRPHHRDVGLPVAIIDREGSLLDDVLGGHLVVVLLGADHVVRVVVTQVGQGFVRG